MQHSSTAQHTVRALPDEWVIFKQPVLWHTHMAVIGAILDYSTISLAKVIIYSC